MRGTIFTLLAALLFSVSGCGGTNTPATYIFEESPDPANNMLATDIIGFHQIVVVTDQCNTAGDVCVSAGSEFNLFIMGVGIPESNCTDGDDNDRNGASDCDDDACWGHSSCMPSDDDDSASDDDDSAAPDPYTPPRDNGKFWGTLVQASGGMSDTSSSDSSNWEIYLAGDQDEVDFDLSAAGQPSTYPVQGVGWMEDINGDGVETLQMTMAIGRAGNVVEGSIDSSSLFITFQFGNNAKLVPGGMGADINWLEKNMAFLIASCKATVTATETNNAFQNLVNAGIDTIGTSESIGTYFQSCP